MKHEIPRTLIRNFNHPTNRHSLDGRSKPADVLGSTPEESSTLGGIRNTDTEIFLIEFVVFFIDDVVVRIISGDGTDSHSQIEVIFGGNGGGDAGT